MTNYNCGRQCRNVETRIKGRARICLLVLFWRARARAHCSLYRRVPLGTTATLAYATHLRALPDGRSELLFRRLAWFWSKSTSRMIYFLNRLLACYYYYTKQHSTRHAINSFVEQAYVEKLA